MHRLLVDTSMLESDAPALPKDAARHLKVLRPEDITVTAINDPKHGDDILKDLRNAKADGEEAARILTLLGKK